MRWTHRGIAVLSAFLMVSAVEAAPRVTHKQVHAIKVKGTGGGSLQSMTRTSDGRIAALVGASRYTGVRAGKTSTPDSEILIYDKDGKELKTWKVEFAAQAIGAGPDGSIFVGGDGKIARYDANGKLQRLADLPHVAELLADKETLKERAKAQYEVQKKSQKQTRRTNAAQIRMLKTRIAALEKANVDEVADDDRPKRKQVKISDVGKRRLQTFKQQLAALEEVDVPDDGSEEQFAAILQQIAQQAAMISGISSTADNVFVVCREQAGHGFAAWRMDHEFQNPVKVLADLRGCCGQMDVQAKGNELFVAENTRKRVGRYDQNGKVIEEFGTTASRKNTEGFGGCCNPMNLCFGPEGQILTAESEGIIRRFSREGKYLGLVGRVNLSGGCKNVSVAASPEGDRVYFCDLPGSRIVVMGPITSEAEAETLGEPPRGAAGAGSEAETDDENAR